MAAKDVTEATIEWWRSDRLADHPGDCRDCGTGIVTRSGLVGTVGGRPACGECLRQAVPALGWAVIWIERTTAAMGGFWPRSTEGPEMGPPLALLEAAGTLGPLVPDNDRLAVGLELFALVARAVKHQMARIIDQLRALAADRGIELEISPDLAVEELFQILERLEIDPGGFFAELWGAG